jgi:hypothetical protein
VTYAQNRLAALEASLGTLDVTSEETVRVQVDKQSEVRPPVRLHATPGVHAVVVRGEGWLLERRVTFEAGTTKPLSIGPKDRDEALGIKPAPVVTAPPVKAPPPPVPPKPVGTGPNGLRVAGWVTGGVGVALLGTAGVLWYEAGKAHEDYLADPSAELRDRGLTYVTLTNTSLIAGGVLTAVGATLLLWPTASPPTASSAQARVEVTWSGAGLGARGIF